MVHAMFQETVSQKLLVFTLYVYLYMSNGVYHFNLLDKLKTTFGVLFLVLFLFKFIANNSEGPDPTPPWLCGVRPGSALFANVQQNGGKV